MQTAEQSLVIDRHKQQVKQYETSMPYVKMLFGETPILFATPNEKCSYFALSINEREPKTNEWIKSFSKGDVFFDIGANNGIYGLMAARLSDCEVYAFEPHFGSYYVLCLNIYANQLQERMHAYPLAISAQDGFGTLYLSALYAGKSLNNFGVSRPHHDPLWNATIPQASITASLDHLTQALGVIPTHIKIDVDGIEPDIVNGAAQTLNDTRVKSVMVELDTKDATHLAVFNTMVEHGFVRHERDPAGIFFYR